MNKSNTQVKMFGLADIDSMTQLQKLSPRRLAKIKAVASVLPFRVNNYIVDELIDWDNMLDDPIFHLTFPQPGMLASTELRRMMRVMRDGNDSEIKATATEIQLGLNPHPAGQLQLNRPELDGHLTEGMQHKYRETVLFFPAAAQTCFAFCTYCFRWPQFVGIDQLKLASNQTDELTAYLREHKEVRSVLYTGGDPLIMRAALLRKYIEPLLAPEFEHVTSIRIGTKTPAYWPYRFVTDSDSDELLRLFEDVTKAGKHLAIMSHYSHPRFIENEISQTAIKRIQATGALIRCQAPLVKHVNDSAEVWSRMWRLEEQLGMVPYYMFVERDTGARRYFEVPLWRCLQIFQEAYSTLSGLGRTVRGPSMSCTPGKVLVDGIAEVAGKKVFVLKFLQGRDPRWVNQIFFAEYDESASWFDHLKPAFGQRFFFDSQLESMMRTGQARVWLNNEYESESATA